MAPVYLRANASSLGFEIIPRARTEKTMSGEPSPSTAGVSRWKTRLSRAFNKTNRRVFTHDGSNNIENVNNVRRHSTVDIPLQCYETHRTAVDGSTQYQERISALARTVSEPAVTARTQKLKPNPLTTATSTKSFRSSASQALNVKEKVHSLFHVWDNRFALKIFGSRNGIQREEERRKNCKHWVIHPCSKFRIYWDLLMLGVLVLNVILLPVAIAFFHESYDAGWLVFNGLSDLTFVVDIVLNFWTGVVDNETHVLLDLSEIRKYYAKRWLALDILSVFPFDYIFQGIFQWQTSSTISSAIRLLRLVKLISLLRLFRVVRFLHYLSKWEELLNATKSIARVVKFVLAVFLLAHWNGCIQFLVPYIQEFPKDSWVSINKLQNASIGTQYSWGIFKAFSHMLCIGFGRWPPQNTTELWVTIISMLIGASLYAMFIGHISNLIHSVTSASRSYNEKLKQVEEYMRYRKLPADLKVRVHEYYYQRYHGQLFDEEAILLELSQALKEDIINFNCQELVRVVPFFANAEEPFITSVITRLTFEVFLPLEHIIRCGAIGNKMYFIQHGTVDVISSEGNLVTQLSDGSYFGEICLLMQCRRVAGVRATTVCDLYCLSKEDFDLVLDEFPSMRLMMESVAKERLEMIHESVNSPRANGSSLLPTIQLNDSSLTDVSPRHDTRYVPSLNVIQSSSFSTIDPGDIV